MKFLVDECVGATVVRWLRNQGHDVLSVYDDSRGENDIAILERAFREDRILVTLDKDFGEHIYRDRLPHKGIVLLRLVDDRGPSKLAAIQRLLKEHANEIADRFVVSEKSIRIVQPHPSNGRP